jgi:hypothetical protein
LNRATLNGPTLGRASLGRAALGRAALGRAALGRAALGRAALGGAALGGSTLNRSTLGWSTLSWSALSGALVAAGGRVGPGPGRSGRAIRTWLDRRQVLRLLRQWICPPEGRLAIPAGWTRDRSVVGLVALRLRFLRAPPRGWIPVVRHRHSS